MQAQVKVGGVSKKWAEFCNNGWGYVGGVIRWINGVWGWDDESWGEGRGLVCG